MPIAPNSLVLLVLGFAPQESRPRPPAPPPAPTTAAEFAERLDEAGVRFDRARKEVRVRGDLLRRRRSRDYPIEYGLVGEGGFTHEAFGIVKCTPSLLNACFLALGLEPGRPRRRVLKDPLPAREDVEVGLVEPFDVLPPSGDRAFLYVTWTEDDGRAVVRAFEDFFVDMRDMKPLPMRGYVYLGSRFEDVPAEPGGEPRRIFVADYEGNIVTLHPDKSRAENCLFDVYSHDDSPYVWADVDEAMLPPEGAAIEFLFTLLPRPEGRPFEPEPARPPIPLPHARELAKDAKNPLLDGSNDEWLDRIGERDLRDLAGMLQRARPPLREVAAELLGASRREEAVEPLAVSLRFDRIAEVRLAAAYALVEIGTPSAFAALVALLDHAELLARDDALVALRYASGEDFGLKPLPWREWLEKR